MCGRRALRDRPGLQELIFRRLKMQLPPPALQEDRFVYLCTTEVSVAQFNDWVVDRVASGVAPKFWKDFRYDAQVAPGSGLDARQGRVVGVGGHELERNRSAGDVAAGVGSAGQTE